MLRVVVDSANGDNVRVNLPIAVITSVLKATGKLPIRNVDMEGIDFEMLIETIIAALDNEMIGEMLSRFKRRGCG